MEVQRLIKGDAETKYCDIAARTPSNSSDLSSFVAFSSAITSTAEIYAALPALIQGTDEHQRIGDRLNPISCTVKLRLETPTANSLQSCDKDVHVWLLDPVEVKSLDNYTAIPILQLLDKGDGTNTSFDGTIGRTLLAPNGKAFRVLHHKVVRLVKGFGNPIGTTGTNVGSTDSVVTPSRHFANLSMRVRLPKTLKYDSSSAVYPTNAAPFFVIGFVNNSETNGATNLVDLYVQGRTSMKYKDM